MADQVVCCPVEIGRDGDAKVFRCLVPSGVRSVVLASGSSCSAPVRQLQDTSRGGIAVSALRTRTCGSLYELPLAGSAFCGGWHRPEGEAVTYRWSMGPAKLRLPHGTTTLELSLIPVPPPMLINTIV
jgi:hypothetical protein